MRKDVSVATICLLSLFKTGLSLKCYSCYAKYGSDPMEMTHYEHGPCWMGSNFDGSQVDGIYCKHECIRMFKAFEVFDSNRPAWIRTYTIFRGCAPYDGCDNIKEKPTDREYPSVQAKCCNTTYCNAAVRTGSPATSPVILAAVGGLATYLQIY